MMKHSLLSFALAVSMISSLSAEDAVPPIQPPVEIIPVGEDLATIVRTSVLEDADMFKTLLLMQARESLEQINAQDLEDLMQKFDAALQSPEVIAQLGEPYKQHFTHEEIVQIRVLYESPLYKKLKNHYHEIRVAQFNILKGILEELMHQYTPVESQHSHSKIVKVTQDNFAEEVEQSEMPVIAAFYAPWDRGCQFMKHSFKASSKKYTDLVKFVRIHVEQEQELSQRFEITSIPTLVFFKNGQVVEVLPNATLSPKALDEKIEAFLNN